MLTITINTENATFEGTALYSECVKLLREVSYCLASGQVTGTLRDANGNVVGGWAPANRVAAERPSGRAALALTELRDAVAGLLAEIAVAKLDALHPISIQARHTAASALAAIEAAKHPSGRAVEALRDLLNCVEAAPRFYAPVGMPEVKEARQTAIKNARRVIEAAKE